MTDILLLEDEPAAYLERWSELAPERAIHTDVGITTAQASACSYWLGQPDRAASLLRRGACPHWLQSTWAGYTPLLALGLPRDYRFSRAVGLFGQSIAEYALTYILQHERQVEARRHAQDSGRWDTTKPGTLAARRLLLVGAGAIGQDVARLLEPFGMRITGIAREARDLPGFAKVLPLADLHHAAADADVVLNLLPDTPQTHDVYTSDFFAALPSGALFINAGRGCSVVDEDLTAALARGHLAGAVLDVFRQEPLPATHPFWTTPNLTLTAHVAGPTPPEAAIRLFLDNLQRLERGESLRGAVDLLMQSSV